jgi:hypothetical protein
MALSPYLVAEDLLLLLLDEKSGKVTASDSAEVALGGAVLAELAILGAVTVEERTSRWKAPKVTVTGPVPEDRVLADAVEIVAQQERTAQDLVGRRAKEVAEGAWAAKGVRDAIQATNAAVLAVVADGATAAAAGGPG